MFTVKIMNEFLHGPIWILGADGITVGEHSLTLVEDDDRVSELNEQIGLLFDSYYEFDSHDQACWFNEEQQRADRDKMLGLLAQLHQRLDELNDGSFVVEDRETPFYESL